MKNKLIELAKRAPDFQVDLPFTSIYLLRYFQWLTPYYSFLYLVCKELKPSLMVELGTNCGMGALHLALGNPDGKVVTIDTDADARKRLEGYSFYKNFSNIEIVHDDSSNAVGRFEDNSIDLLFIDGDHRYEYAMKDYNAYFPKVKIGGLILFDDINLSEEMQMFWNDIRGDKTDISFLRPKDTSRPTRGCGFGFIIKE